MTRPSDTLDDLEEALRRAAEGRQASLWTALPALVTEVDLQTQTVNVQPTIQAKVADKDGNIQDVTLPLLLDVPIVWPRAGGFALTLPVTVGDEVLVVFASTCIDSWWQSGTIGPQAEVRRQDLSDGFAILAPTSQPKVLPNVSPVNVQLRNEDGDDYLEITPQGRIKLVTTTAVEVTSPTISLTGSTNVSVTAPNISLAGGTNISIGAPNISVSGSLGVTGNIALTGNIVQAAPGTITTGGLVLNTHRHGGLPQGSPPGSFITAPPIN